MVSITMSLKGGANLIRQIDLFDKVSIKDIGKHYPKVLDYMEDEKNKNFKTKGRSLVINKPRKNIDSKTKKARSRRYGHYKQSPSSPSVLRRTGNLQDNITKKHDKVKASMTFNAPYATFPQNARGKFKRTLFEFNSRINTNIIKILQVALNKEIGIWNLRGRK